MIQPSNTTTSVAPTCYTITSSAGANGNVSPLGVVNVVSGGSQTFNITPAANYHIASVLVDGNSVGTPASYTFNGVTANHTISASFAIDTRTITSSAGANGSISPSGAVVVNYGSNQGFTITSNANAHIADVQVDSVSQGAIASYTFNNVTVNHTIAASFALNTISITSAPGTAGAGNPSNIMVTLNGPTQGINVNTAANGTGCTLTGTTSFPASTSMTIPVTFAASNPPANHNCTVTVSASPDGTYTPATTGSITVLEGTLDCNTALDPNLTNPGGGVQGTPGYASGQRLQNKDSSTCQLVNYSFDNTVLANDQIHLTWDTGAQPTAVFTYTVYFLPEFVDPATGYPKRRLKVAWESDKYGVIGPVWVWANSCLSPANPPKIDMSVMPIDPNPLRPDGGPNPYFGQQDHMCMYDEMTVTVPPGSGRCTLAQLQADYPGTVWTADKTAPPWPACVERSGSAYDIGDGFFGSE
jgi:hypothetical protein